MIEKDLTDESLEWMSFAPAGADQPARMVLLHQSDDTLRRTVLVCFPAGWERGLTGHQPAGEEIVVLDGALSMSGQTAHAGEVLVVEPRATRSATASASETRAVVFFSGPPGGWTEGAAADRGELSVRRLVAGVVRDGDSELGGSLEVLDSAALTSFSTDVDLCWPAHGHWVHLPAGEPAPGLTGDVVVRRWA